MKKIVGDIIILHICTKVDNHMRYSSWATKWDRQNFLSLWAIFCPFTPLTTQKIKILKKNKLLEMSSFYTFVTKTMIIWCMLPEKWSATNKIFCHFGSLCGLSPPTNNPKYWKLEKCKKILKGDIFLLHMCAINKCYMMSGSWGIRHDRHSFLSFSAICCPFTPFFLFWTS